jgi:hypothetical protein
MRLIPHDRLEETEMSEFSERTDSSIQTIVEATEQYDLENELQSGARHAKEDEVVCVNPGHLVEEQVVVDSIEGDQEDDEDALLEFRRHLMFTRLVYKVSP